MGELLLQAKGFRPFQARGAFYVFCDIENTKLVLRWLEQKKIQVKVIETKLPSPFALHLILQGHSDLIRIEDKQEFLKRMHDLHVKGIEE